MEHRASGRSGPTTMGSGIYFNGNAAGTDCIDATPTPASSSIISGSLMAPAARSQFSINDSEHDDMSSDPNGT